MTEITFTTIMMDPPWPEHGGGKVKRGADRHYALLQPREMPLVIAKSGMFRPSLHAHLYIWVTNNYLPAGIWLMQQLGFDYKTNVAWKKQRAGLGQYFRGQHELMLFGVRNNGMDRGVMTERKDLVSCIEAPHVLGPDGKPVHSAKPPEFYEHIEARSQGPYLEMFARSEREGWTSWGLEVNGGAAEVQAHAG